MAFQIVLLSHKTIIIPVKVTGQACLDGHLHVGTKPTRMAETVAEFMSVGSYC